MINQPILDKLKIVRLNKSCFSVSVSTEKIIIYGKEDLAPLRPLEESKNKNANRVDINDLLARVREEKKKENKVNLVFFGLFTSMVFIVGIILSF